MVCQLPSENQHQRRRGDTLDAGSRPPPAAPHDYLQQLPALILLSRMPTPVMALGLDGEVIYANPAFAAMLGYPHTGELPEASLPALMAGHASTSPRDCVTELRAAAGRVTDWCHADGYHSHAIVSDALLCRATDSVLLITLTDVTDVLWSTNA
jgi:PAS domain-containing protein